jgi:hypothetical protein
VYLHRDPVDFRLNINGLAALVQQEFIHALRMPLHDADVDAFEEPVQLVGTSVSLGQMNRSSRTVAPCGSAAMARHQRCCSSAYSRHAHARRVRRPAAGIGRSKSFSADAYSPLHAHRYKLTAGDP